MRRWLVVIGLAQAATVDLLDGVSTWVTVDGVMGGLSSAQLTAINGTYVFEGDVNTNGGGFAYATFVPGDSMNLSSASGLWARFSTMDFATYGAAPVAITVTLKSSGAACSLVGAFAVPTTQSATAGAQWVPLSRFAPKGNHWAYSSGQTDVPSYCDGSTTSLAGVDSFTLGVYYQDGPFHLALRALEARSEARASVFASAEHAPSLISEAAARASNLISKVGAGVGAHQMNSLAAATLEAAALQSAISELVAAVNASWHLEAVARASQLRAAFDTWLTGYAPTAQPTVTPAPTALPVPRPTHPYAPTATPTLDDYAPTLVPTSGSPNTASRTKKRPLVPVRFAACGIVAVLSLVVLAALATIVRRRDRSLVTPSAGITVMRDEKAPATTMSVPTALSVVHVKAAPDGARDAGLEL